MNKLKGERLVKKKDGGWWLKKCEVTKILLYLQVGIVCGLGVQWVEC